MLRRSHISFFFIVAAMCFASVSASAQYAPVSGMVEMQKADGTREPVAGAVIEVYEMESKTGAPSAKSGRNGAFSFAGLRLGPTFAFSVSAPGASPTVFAGVRAGQDKILITMSPGDGKKFTADEARAMAARTGSAPTATQRQPSEDEKKAAAEFEAKRKEVEDKNKKAEKVNEVTARTLKEGNAAFEAKDLNLAIAKYDEGIEADPNFVGAAPVLLNNRGIVLRERAIITFNRSVTEKDLPAEGRLALLASVKKDISDSAESFQRSWNLLSNAAPTDIGDKVEFEKTKVNALRGARDTFRDSVRTRQVAPEAMEAATKLIPEFIRMESDAARKAEAELIIADMYRVSQDRKNAAAAYKKILEASPNNADALVGAGLMLVDIGWNDGDDASTQEGANLLQKFVGIADDKHALKKGAQDYLDILKTQNVTPQKVPAPVRRRN
jgi:tetratricopeptide (TPR) repeat protein